MTSPYGNCFRQSLCALGYDEKDSRALTSSFLHNRSRLPGPSVTVGNGDENGELNDVEIIGRERLAAVAAVTNLYSDDSGDVVINETNMSLFVDMFRSIAKCKHLE